MFPVSSKNKVNPSAWSDNSSDSNSSTELPMNMSCMLFCDHTKRPKALYSDGTVRQKASQHSVHPTGGSLRVFRHLAWLEADSVKIALSHPAHQPVTQAVGQRTELSKS